VEIAISIGIFILGVALVVGSAEKLVESLVGVSLAFGVSTFLLGVLLVGFDAENLAVGVDASARGLPEVALGTIIGASLVAIAFALGLTALITPIRLDVSRKGVLLVAPLAVLLLAWLLSLDGELSRLDGGLLLIGFAVIVGYLLWESQRGLVIRGEAEEAMEEAQREHHGRLFYIALVVAALVDLAVGAEMVVWSTRRILALFDLPTTVFGMIVVAFAISMEELARTLVPALKGRAEISLGNVVGSAAYFFTFNAGLIALTAPVVVPPATQLAHYPFAFAAAALVGLIAIKQGMGRAVGALLLGIYGSFVALVALELV
jgi:cation:H+ antiporter